MTARSLRSVFVVGGALFALPAAVLPLAILPACNAERKEECEKFLAVTKPLDQGTPSVDAVERVQSDVGAIKFEDTPLDVFAKNYRETLTVLSNTLKLQASPEAPDGTDDVVKKNAKDVRTQRSDAARYCAQ